ncbi:MAG: UDP-3-O-(3-hydroxymyristoyl)glucosamine N-acyltransferase [Breznakibacter sp.]
MKFTAEQIAGLLHGKVEGDPSETITGVSKIEEGKPGTLAFLANPKYNRYIYTTEASVVLVNDDFIAENPVPSTLIRVPDAYRAIAKLLEMYEQMQPQKTGVEQPSFIDVSAKVGEFAYIGAFAYVGENVKIGHSVKIYPHAYIGDNVTVGDNTIIYSGVKIYKHCKIGNNCIIHAGAVIGSDGFGFAPDENNVYKKIAQVGNVVIEDDVEIGANTTIDRATMGSTFIRKGAKLDNLIQVAHNVEIGENAVIAAQTGIAGSTKIGKNVMFGGQVGIAGHITIADGVKLAAQTGVSGSINEPNSVYMGAPAFDVRQYNRAYVVFRKLPEIYSQLNQLQKEFAKEKNK